MLKQIGASTAKRKTKTPGSTSVKITGLLLYSFFIKITHSFRSAQAQMAMKHIIFHNNHSFLSFYSGKTIRFTRISFHLGNYFQTRPHPQKGWGLRKMEFTHNLVETCHFPIAPSSDWPFIPSCVYLHASPIAARNSSMLTEPLDTPWI